ADIAARHPGGPVALWRDRLACAALTTAAVGHRPCVNALRVVPANGGRLIRIAGPGWAAVGDAATAWDPLSSQGIATALAGGFRAGMAAAAAVVGDPSPLTEYVDWAEATWADYVRQHRYYYGLVKR